MITNALPISADFKVFVEGSEVPKRVIKEDDIEVKVDITDPDLRKSVKSELQALWFDILERQQPGMKIDEVPKEKYALKVEKVPDPQKITQYVNALIVPELGPVMGYAVITKNSLTTDKLTERGYANNGFAIRVHGKLVNPEDELFGVSARSHAYWSRFFAELEIPGLDKVLLVQRNAVSENSNEAQIARAVVKVLFNFTRIKDDEARKDETKYVPESFGSRLRTLSPIAAPIALSGLVESILPEKGLDSIDVDFSSLGENGPAVRYDDTEKKILVNEDHPLIEALDELGQSSKSDLRHVIGEVLAGTELAKGYLRSQGVQERIVRDTADIIEVSVRSAAQFVVDAVEVHIKEINDTSYEGGTRFENAVVSAFRNLRLAAIRYGDSDEPDGIIEIPISGAPNLFISVEAKGSKGVISHKELSEATVIRHSEEYNCTNAIAIAREFTSEGLEGKESALFRETRGKVPLITTSAIALILRLHKKRPFTYDKIIKILTTWTPPNELNAFIKTTWAELPELGLMRLILEVAHEQIQKDDTNLPEPGMILADERIRQRKLKKADLINILTTIQITTSMIIVDPAQGYQFRLLQNCDTIIRALEKDPDEEKSPAGTLQSYKN